MASNSQRRSASSDSRSKRSAQPRSARSSRSSAPRRQQPRSRAADARAQQRVRQVSVGGSKGTPNQVHMSSVRVGDIRRDARRTSGAPTARRAVAANPWVRRIGIAFAVIIALVIVYVALYFSSLFPVTKVTVTGATHLTSSELTDLAQVPQGTTLLRVDTAGIESRLESNAWVSHAQVNRIFPDTIELSITERSIAAVVDVTSTEGQQTEHWAIAGDGTWLLDIPDENSSDASSVSDQIYQDASQVLHITDVPYGVKPVVGAHCSDESVINALDIVANLTTELSGRVTTVSATDAANTIITLDNGVQIAFGSADTAEEVREKEQVCLELMNEHPEVTYINVRVTDRPTWRSL
jgi:cell division protein FtsQ